MMVIRPVTKSNLKELLPLARRIFVESFAHQNNPDDFQAYVSKAFTEEQLISEFQHPDSLFFCAYWSDQMIGYMKLNFGAAQTELQDANALEIERIYVDRKYQGKGIGKTMMDKAIKIAQQRLLEYIWLGVWEHNPKAIGFYERNGFVAFGTHSFWLGNDEQRDILMRKKLK
ncbi:MAG: GNAT family N-acetyltransferase [Bacteroidota bacterium]